MNDRYVDIPAWTTILGAAKVVGRARKGWTFGVLEAVTGREYAQLSNGAQSTKAEVEPLTSYTVFRAQRELGRRGAIGLLGTSVFRDLNEPALVSYLTDRAVMVGVDGHVFLDNARNWVLHGGLAGSSVHGSTDAITRLQKAEQRYLQRPDVDVREAGPGRDEHVGLERPGQREPQQREPDREPGHLGHEPGPRGERRRLLDADGPGRGARHGPVPQADPGPLVQRADVLGVEVVDVELGLAVSG